MAGTGKRKGRKARAVPAWLLLLGGVLCWPLLGQSPFHRICLASLNRLAGGWIGEGAEYTVHVMQGDPTRVVKVVNTEALVPLVTPTQSLESIVRARLIRKQALYELLRGAEPAGGLRIGRIREFHPDHLVADRVRGFSLRFAMLNSVYNAPENAPLRAWYQAIYPEFDRAVQLSGRAASEGMRALDARGELPRTNDPLLTGHHRTRADLWDENIHFDFPDLPAHINSEAGALRWAIENNRLGPPSEWRRRLVVIDF